MNDAAQAAAVLEGAELLISAGPAGVCMVPQARRGRAAPGLRVVADLNAVPPLGIEGVEVQDYGVEREGVDRLRRARRRRPEDEDPQGVHREAVRAQRPRARRRDHRRRGAALRPRSRCGSGRS